MTTSSERINNMFANSSTWSSKEAELKGRAAIHASQARHTSFSLGDSERMSVRMAGILNQRSETCTMKSSAQHYLQYHTDIHRYTVCYNMLQ